MSVKPHIVRILLRQNQAWWMAHGKDNEYVFHEDGMGKKKKVSDGSAEDIFINERPF